jgi:hypothetical protein
MRVTLRMPKAMVTASALASGKGICSAVPATQRRAWCLVSRPTDIIS